MCLITCFKEKFIQYICLPAIGLGRPSSIVSMDVYVKPESMRPDHKENTKSNMTTWKKYELVFLKKMEVC